MKNLINKNKLLFIYIISIFIISLMFSILEYIGVSYNFLKTLIIILNLIMVSIYAYKNSSSNNLQGYKSGFRSGVKMCLTLLIINIITFNSFSFKTLIYYLIIILISIISAIICKNKQKNYSS